MRRCKASSARCLNSKLQAAFANPSINRSEEAGTSHQERLIHGCAGGAYHARKARRWVSCLSQACQCEFVSTADIPCPKVQPIPSERPARIWRRLSLGFWGTCSIARLSHPRVWRFALCAEYLSAITQRITGHRIVFHAGCVSPLDARKRIALCSRDRAQEPD
jgi:hypothetical protein